MGQCLSTIVVSGDNTEHFQVRSGAVGSRKGGVGWGLTCGVPPVQARWQGPGLADGLGALDPHTSKYSGNGVSNYATTVRM